MPLQIVRNDITLMNVDAVVNAANTALQTGGGVCGAIFKAAGERELRQACDAIGRCETGQAVLTPGFRLPARYIIHAAGPVWRGGDSGEAKLLRDCYRNALALAKDRGCESIAFPLLSSGIYGYPKEEALRVATAAIGEFLGEHDMDVYLVVFDKAAFSLSERLVGEVRSYIGEHYVAQHTSLRRKLWQDGIEPVHYEDAVMMGREAEPASPSVAEAPEPAYGLNDIVRELDESFAQALFRLIDARGKSDVEVYKRANIDRKLFSKIRSNMTSYVPSKKTAVAFAVALELNLDETMDLLARAGYTLSHSQKFDVIIEYFISNGNYDIFSINEALFYFDQPLLGA